MRCIDADKLYPDCMTKNGTLAISQSQIANAPTVELERVKNELNNELNELKLTRPQGDLISRAALKAAITEPLNVNDAGKNDWYEGYYTAKNEDIIEYIDKAPTVSIDWGLASGDQTVYTIPQGDLISRSALRKQFEDRSLEDFTHLHFIDAIDKAPTVEQNWRFYYDHGYSQAKRDFERPQGEWVKDEEHSIVFDIFKCSLCGGGGHTHFRFCPNCGAKMKGGVE